MANNCFYMMRAVSKDRSSLERLQRIMEYKDTEYYIYRVFSVYVDETNPIEDYGGGFFVMNISGDVAWAAWSWIHDDENQESKTKLGAHYSNLPTICRALHIGVEIFAEEEGCEFQEHFRVSANGDITWNEYEDWIPGYDYYDEDGKPCDSDDCYEQERNEEKDEGGVDGYGDYSTCEEIYGEESV